MLCIEGLATIPQVGLPINVTLSMDEAAKAKYSAALTQRSFIRMITFFLYIGLRGTNFVLYRDTLKLHAL